MKEIKKLYRACSVVFDSNGKNGIHVTWYNADIKIYSVKYEEIIKDYSDMLPHLQMTAIGYVDEFFTSDQIKLLEKFIKEELKTELLVEEHHLPIRALEIDKDGDEVINLAFGEAEERGGITTVQLNKLDNYNLPFKVKGAYDQNDCTASNDVIEKLKTNNNFLNHPVNQIVPSDQWDQRELEQICLEALAAGRVQILGGASLKDFSDSLVANRVRFVAVNNPAELGIK